MKEKLKIMRVFHNMNNCLHENIVLVTEKPRDNKGNMQIDKFYVECEYCKTILPIHRVTQEERITKLTPKIKKDLEKDYGWGNMNCEENKIMINELITE